MGEADEERSGADRPAASGLNEKLLDALVYVPAGLALSVAEELPRLAARGRDRLGVRVSSARAVGQFAVQAGHDEFVRRSGGWFHRAGSRGPDTPASPSSPPVREHAPRSGAGVRVVPSPAPSPSPSPAGPATRVTSAGEGSATTAANGHVPPVTSLSIPGFDTLSASQVVQRLDGLNRAELVSVRAYEASTRGRRTILSRVDQLLDERS